MESLKKYWQESTTLTNAWTTIPSAWTTELVATTGYDVMTIDTQHGLATDLAIILPMIQAIEGTGTLPFARLPQNDPAFIMRLLDAGILGLICPMINTAADTDAFVKATKYAPNGFRSYGPTRAAAIHGPDYFNKSKDLSICMAMIETPAALENIKEIVKVENLDGLYVGPWDLSISLGYKKHADFNDPSFWDIMIEISETARAAGLKVGIHAGNPSNAKRFQEIGYSFLTIFNDSSGIRSAAENTLKDFKSNTEGLKVNGY